MASSASSSEVRDTQRPEAGTPETVDVVPERAAHSRSRTVKPDRLPVTELAFDKPGAASPFGDDVTFPLPVDQLNFVAPEHGGSDGAPEHGGRDGGSAH